MRFGTMRKTYFPSVKGSPPPFGSGWNEECDLRRWTNLGIVWHGRYASFFEDARSAAGEKYGFGYPDFYKE